MFLKPDRPVLLGTRLVTDSVNLAIPLVLKTIEKTVGYLVVGIILLKQIYKQDV
jgi:hypothetical protein